tara:strand:+ start:59 stop:505 length:447 start_codon:yes stop_codon:yes gene_type:complete
MNNINPLGKTYKEFQEELEKINLEKTQKIQLGLVDDFNKKLDLLKDFDKFYAKNIGKLRNEYLKARGIAIEVKDLYQDAELNTKEAKEIIQEIDDIFGKLQKAVKDLGLNINDIQGVKEVSKVVANIEDDIDTFEKTEQDYKDLIKAI